MQRKATWGLAVALFLSLSADAAAQEKPLAVLESCRVDQQSDPPVCEDGPPLCNALPLTGGEIRYEFVEGPNFSPDARWDGLTYEQAKQKVRDAAARWNRFLISPTFEENPSGAELSIVMGAETSATVVRENGVTVAVNLPIGPYSTVNPHDNTDAFFKLVFHELLHVFCLEHGGEDGVICPFDNDMDKLGAFWDYGAPGMGELRSLESSFCGTSVGVKPKTFTPQLLPLDCDDSGIDTTVLLRAGLGLNGVAVHERQIEDYRWERRAPGESTWSPMTWNDGNAELSLQACTACPGSPPPEYWVRAKIRYYGRVDLFTTNQLWIDFSCPVPLPP